MADITKIAKEKLSEDYSGKYQRSKQPGPAQNFKKRNAPRLPRRKNDVYVNNKVPTKGLLPSCEKLLQDEGEIVIHGLGSAVASAINLSLQLQQRHSTTLQISINTSSVELTDDFRPDTNGTEGEAQARLNSAVHIRVWQMKTAT